MPFDCLCLSTTTGVLGTSVGVICSHVFGFKVRVRKSRRKKGAPSFNVLGSEHYVASPRVTTIELDHFKVVRAINAHEERGTEPVPVNARRIAFVGNDSAITCVEIENDASAETWKNILSIGDSIYEHDGWLMLPVDALVVDGWSQTHCSGKKCM